MTRHHYIATDEDGNVVGKWQTRTEPTVSDEYDVQEVNDVSEHTLDYLYFDQD